MPNYNTNILIQNIKVLMKDNGVTQEKLAEILGMSQSNVSKALSENDKKSFTLDQVIGIAKHFDDSVDRLVGNRKAISKEYGPRAIAEFLAKLLSEKDATFFTREIQEDVFEINYDTEGGYPSCTHETRKIVYPAFYLPSYWEVPLHPKDEYEANARDEATQCGNETRMEPVNNFLRHYKELFDLYDRGGLSEDTFKTVVDDLLGHLR